MPHGDEALHARVSGVMLLPDEARARYRALTGLDLAIVTAGDELVLLEGSAGGAFTDDHVAAILSALPEPVGSEAVLGRGGCGWLAHRVSPIGAMLSGPLAVDGAPAGDDIVSLGSPEDLMEGLDEPARRAHLALQLVARPFAVLAAQADRARRMLSQITVLNTVGEMVSREPDLERAVQVILETATMLLDADSGSVMLFSVEDPNELRIAHAIGLPEDVVRNVRVRIGEGVSGNVALTGEPLILRAGQRHRLTSTGRAAWDAALCVPLRAKDRVVGVLNIRSTMAAREFDQDDLHLAMTFASQAALAIENARLVQMLNARLEGAQSELLEANIVLLGIRERLENILASLPTPVLVTGHDERITVMNHPAELALGTRREHVLHHPLATALASGEIGSAIAASILGEDGRPRPGLAEVSVGMPTRRELQVRVALIHDPDGRYDGSVLVVSDVTEIKELADLKSELVSITSHEIKTPVTAINLAARTLEGAMDVLEPEEREEIVGIIVNQSVRLKNLVTNLLDLSKIDAGRALDLDLRPTDVGEMARSAIQAVEVGVATKSHTFAVEVDDAVHYVALDRSKIEQVLVNFLTNAIKYSDPGPVLVRVVEDGPAWARFEVCDRGKGISPADLPTVFERFQRVGGDDHRRKAGHGLGLHLCKGLVEAHGGRVGADSIAGEGSTFYFVLPRERDKTEEGDTA